MTATSFSMATTVPSTTPPSIAFDCWKDSSNCVLPALKAAYSTEQSRGRVLQVELSLIEAELKKGNGPVEVHSFMTGWPLLDHGIEKWNKNPAPTDPVAPRTDTRTRSLIRRLRSQSPARAQGRNATSGRRTRMPP